MVEDHAVIGGLVWDLGGFSLEGLWRLRFSA